MLFSKLGSWIQLQASRSHCRESGKQQFIGFSLGFGKFWNKVYLKDVGSKLKCHPFSIMNFGLAVLSLSACSFKEPV